MTRLQASEEPDRDAEIAGIAKAWTTRWPSRSLMSWEEAAALYDAGLRVVVEARAPWENEAGEVIDCGCPFRGHGFRHGLAPSPTAASEPKP